METWLPVVGWESVYEVSSDGRVRSKPRGWSKGKVLSQKPSRWGYMNVHLYDKERKQTRAVHRLVGDAFLGPRPEGMETRHLDGNPANNAATNLKYGTKSENAIDRVRHGNNANANKTVCSNGHPYDEVNTRWTPDGRHRYCLSCKRDRQTINNHARDARTRALRAAKQTGS